MDIINTLRESDNELLKAEAKAIDKWKKLKHTKDDLELLLTYNIAELRFIPKGKREYEDVTITANKRFVKAYSAAKRETKLKALKSPFAGMRIKDKDLVMAYDMEDGRIKTFPLTSWQILNFIPITEENILILDKLVHDCLKK